MPLKRLATIAAVLALVLALVAPHCSTQGLTDLAQLGFMCGKWQRHWGGSLALIVLLIWSLFPPKSGH